MKIDGSCAQGSLPMRKFPHRVRQSPHADISRLLETVRHGRVDLTPLLTHAYPLERIAEAYELFSERRDGVHKVAVGPSTPRGTQARTYER